MASHAASFSDLLRATIEDCKKLSRPVIVGSLLFFALNLVTGVFGTILSGSLPGASGMAAGKALTALFRMIISVVMTLYFLLLAVEQKTSMGEIVRKITLPLVWNLIVTWFWTFIRSYLWLAVIGVGMVVPGVLLKSTIAIALGGAVMAAGIVAAFIVGPRYFFTNIILIKEGLKPRACVEASYKRTQFYWGKIVGNSLLMGIVYTGAYAVSSILFGVGIGMLGARTAPMMLVGLLIVLIGGIAFIVLALYAAAIFQFFHVRLYDTIKAHPRKQ